MAASTRSVRKSCEDRSTKSEYRPRTDLYKHFDAPLAGSGALGRANARDGSDIARGENPKRLHRFLVERRHAPAEVDWWIKCQLVSIQMAPSLRLDGTWPCCNAIMPQPKKILETSSVNELSYATAGLTPKIFFEGCTYLAQGDNVNAQKAFEQAQTRLRSSRERSTGERRATREPRMALRFDGAEERCHRRGTTRS